MNFTPKIIFADVSMSPDGDQPSELLTCIKDWTLSESAGLLDGQ